jgi:drug/metabolite transporter (DMT)-like permease
MSQEGIPSEPLAAGTLVAVASAIAFGASTPLVQHAGRGVGPFTTAALLYAGASIVSAGRRTPGEASLQPRDAPRLVAVAALGAVVAPVALAWGLQRTNAMSASLLLNLEALFTVLLARLVWREPIGARVAVALAALLASGLLLVGRGTPGSLQADAGAIAVVVATLAWAADNVIGRPLSDCDPRRVVLVKSALGAVLSTTLACAAREPFPATAAAGSLVACGAIGYGLSLRLYLRAQRVIGAARTGSIFAVAPFVGAAIAWSLGSPAGGVTMALAAALSAIGIGLHWTEHHGHAHEHEAMEHEHAHSHDDLHHAHRHDGEAAPGPGAEHTHRHRHERATHDHPHALDIHHRHKH